MLVSAFLDLMDLAQFLGRTTMRRSPLSPLQRVLYDLGDLFYQLNISEMVINSHKLVKSDKSSPSPEKPASLVRRHTKSDSPAQYLVWTPCGRGSPAELAVETRFSCPMGEVSLVLSGETS